MTIADHCAECGDVLDPLKRLYRGPGGLPRCAVCQVIAEANAELLRVAETLRVLAAIEVERGGVN